MPIQIPKITADPNVQQNNAPRIQSQGIDAVTPMQKDQQALNDAGDQAIRYGNEIAYQHADTNAAIRRNTFLEWDARKRHGNPQDPNDDGGLMNQKGDPHVLFEQYEKERNAKLKELSTAPEGENWSNMTQKIVNRRLNRADEETQLEMLTQYGHMYQRWNKETDDASEMLIRQQMPFASSQITMKPDGTVDPTSFGAMNTQIKNLRQLIISSSIKDHTGAVAPDGSGEYARLNEATGQTESVNLTDVAKSKLNASMGRALSETLQNLINSAGPEAPGSLEKARAFRQQYGSMIDQYDLGKSTKDLQKAEIEQQANDLSSQLRGKSPEEIVRITQNVPEEIRRKALKYNEEQARSIEQTSKIQQDTNNDKLQKAAIQFRQNNPTASVSDFERTTEFKLFSPKMSIDQNRNVERFFTTKQTTDPKAMSAAIALINSPDPSKVTQDDYFKASATLGTDKEGNFLSQRLRELGAPSSAAKNQVWAHAAAAIKDQALALKFIPADNQTRTDIAKNGDSREILNTETMKFWQEIAPFAGHLTADQIEKKANEFVLREKQNQPAEESGFSIGGHRFFGGTDVPAAKTGLQIGTNAAPPPSGKTEIQIRAAAKNEYISKFKTQPNQDQLNDYVKTNRERLSQ